MPSIEKAKEQLTKMVEILSSEKLPDTISKTYLESAGIPSDEWTLSNRMLMYFEGTQDARGYRQWLKVGRHVKKGSKAMYILAPRKIKKTETGDDGKEREKMMMAGFVGVPVFRYEDTDGCPLVTVKNEPKTVLPLKDVAEKWGISVRYDGSRHGEYGSYNLETDEIRLCTDSVDTFFHELAHKAHNKFETLKPGQDPEQETVAQLTACVLSKIYGYDVTGDTQNYIGSYAEENTPEAVGRLCFKVLGKVEKILDMILKTEAEISAKSRKPRQEVK